MGRGNRKRDKHTEMGPWPYQKNHRALWERQVPREMGRWATGAGGRREGGRENKRVKLSELQVGLSRDTSGGLGGRGRGAASSSWEAHPWGCRGHQAKGTWR